MISKFIRLEVCRDIAFGFSFSWLGLRVGGHCWLGLRVGGHCLEWLAVGLSRFLIYLALSPHLIIWSCEAVCPYGSRVCHGLPNRLWVAWVSRFKCRYLDTQLWQWYCFLNNWHDTLSEAVGGNQILGVHLYNFATIPLEYRFLWNIGFFTARLFETEFSLAWPMVVDLSMSPVGYDFFIFFFNLWVIKLAWTVWGIFIDMKLAWTMWGIFIDIKLARTVWKYIYRHEPHLDCITNPNL